MPGYGEHLVNGDKSLIKLSSIVS